MRNPTYFFEACLSFLLISFTIFIGAMSYNLINETNNKQPPKQQANQTYQQDSLCQVWVDSTHLRVAFKTWYNNKGKVK